MALSLCGQSGANLGALACDVSKGVAKKIFIYNGAIAASDYATDTALLAKLVTYSQLSKDDANKVFTIPEIQDVQDASEQNTEGTLGLGFKAVVREGRPAYTFKVFASADQLKRLRKFNNKTVRLFEYDANGVLWGTKSGSTFVGYQAKLFVSGGKMATGQNIEEGVVTIGVSFLSVTEYIDNSYYASISGNIEDVAPLMDVAMTKISNATNVYKIGLYIPAASVTGDFNIYDDYGAAVAALVANFSAKSGASYGTSLAITTIAVDPALKCLTVTFDSTAYGALAASTPIKLIPPTPTQLAAGNVTGLELLPVAFTK